MAARGHLTGAVIRIQEAASEVAAAACIEPARAYWQLQPACWYPLSRWLRTASTKTVSIAFTKR